ncbi:unnamed protein product, partial [Mesorhabditis spiculigera]
MTVREWFRQEAGLNGGGPQDFGHHHGAEKRALPNEETTQLPRFEVNRGVFLDDDYMGYQMGYRHVSPWLEKVFNKYAGKQPDPGNHPMDFGRHKYTPVPRPYL